MPEIEAEIAGHYSPGALFDRILEGLARLGKTPESATAEDLKPVDEFHAGGLAATEALLDQLAIGPETRILDIGCGIGGTARYIAGRWGAPVHGIDLTPEFVDTAARLGAMVGVPATFAIGNALDLPVADQSFDLALLLHVGMNVPDKPRLFAEAARALAPGGTFAIYDMMRTGPGELAFPQPWATSPHISFLETPESYRAAAEAAGFTIAASRDRGDFARDFFARLTARLAESGPPPIGLHLILGEHGRDKIANVIAALEARIIAPTEMICRLPAA